MDNTGETDQDEARLIARARQDDESAWTSLVVTYQEPVFRLAYLILGDRYEAEDAAQEAFLRAYRSLDRFDRARPLRPWLLSIAANTAKNKRRAGWRYLNAVKRLFRLESGIAADLRETVQSESQANRLWQAVRFLASPDQQVIYLRYFLELSVEETAAVLEIPQGTVKSRLHRALARLRNVIEREFPDLMDEG